MTSFRLASVSLFLLLLPTGTAFALSGDAAEGKRLHQANCVGCHDTSVYTRKQRTVHSLDGLQAQMSACSHVAGKKLSATETENLVKYLNDEFYKFE